jgi:uncharacterized phiE125 gp8 family phage protein
MSAFLLTPPAIEPLTLAEAKQFLRVEHTDDDATIASLIATARTQVESMARCALIAQTWRLVRDAWPVGGRIVLKRGPLFSVVAARVFDAAGNAITVDPETFALDKASAAIAAPPWSLPVPGRSAAGIEIDVVLGFGSTAASVPEPLRQAVRLLLTHWYENRGLGAPNEGAAALAGLSALVAPYRALSL